MSLPHTMPIEFAVLFQASSRLMTLAPVDLAIIALYFVVVLGIGFYLKRFTKTGEDFFLAGREMTAWIAGLSFRRRQPRLAGTDGLGGARPINTASWRRTGIGSAPFRPCCSSAS